MIFLTEKIQRQVHFVTAQIYDSGDTSGKNNTWSYNRAPDGYLFELISVDLSVTAVQTQYAGIVQLSDGHEYTHWNIYPGVQTNELLYRAEFNIYNLNSIASLHGWECKEYTIGARSVSDSKAFKSIAIVWYYLKKASRLELLEYAVKHPRNQDMFRRALRGTTIEPSEEDA